MYTPYGNVAAQGQPNQFIGGQQNLQHPQPQHPSFQQQQFNVPPQAHQQQHPQSQQQVPGGGASTSYTSFLNDPAAALAGQFARNGFEQSNQYIQQNFGSFIPTGTTDLKYYFQVSNSYVLKKIFLILFPYRNKNWNRLSLQDVTGESSSSSPSNSQQFAPPNLDVNAPDLYIPTMSFVTYILLWAAFQGLKGDFHPQLFGYLSSQTLAFTVLDITIFKVGLYLLNCSSQISLWDLVGFSSYKYVTIIVLLCWKNLVSDYWLYYYPVLFGFIVSLALFLLRSLRFSVLPSLSVGTTTITSKQRRIRIQFLFVYAVVVQGLIVLFMSY
ncbi:YIF1-domain-containing protein [Scheffersomyces coipomensis]|uniref:YIF1-domain-containing protein n=1 Tax=Scheffersomyces coipomensis TaxID=1788519 RepID=UPI00315CAFC4